MNQHNRLFHALKAMADKPAEFTRKLDWDEQRAMHAADPAKYVRYTDWLFASADPGPSARWAKRERGEDQNREAQSLRNTAHAEGWGWPEHHKQSGT